MKNTNRILSGKYNGGFVGLLMLLICVSIIALIIVRTDLFKGFPTGQSGNQNTFEHGIDAINAAKNAKNLIEQNSKNTNKQLQ